MTYHITQHAEVRMNQRSFRTGDLEMILATAEQVAPDAFLMTHDVTDREIARRKHEIQQLERLRGKKLVVEGDVVVTAYHARKSEEIRNLRKGRVCA